LPKILRDKERAHTGPFAATLWTVNFRIWSTRGQVAFSGLAMILVVSARMDCFL
jgi:hypothetical protein